MNKINYLNVFTVLLFLGALSLQRLQAQNRPVVQTKFTADPAPMVHNGTVYLYTSHDEDDAPEGMGRFLMKEWLLYSSTDMVNWTDHGAVASLKNFEWTENKENGAWAPHCIERNGKFYLYCPTPGGTGMGVLVADSPFGPFKDPIGKPLVMNSCEDIDPAILIDDDGQAYMYWGNPNLWYAKLNEDMVTISGDIVKDPLVRKEQGKIDQYHYQEGPWAYKRNGHYYMAYASTCCPEGIGYAMGKSAIGPWKFKGHIMQPDRRASGNHPGIIDYKGKTYMFGFNFLLNFRQTEKHHERRSVCVAEMKFNPDGTIQELPWWEEGTPIDPVGTLDPYKRTEAETIAWSEGLKTKSSASVGVYVTSVHVNDYIRVREVDFKKGAKIFEVSAASVSGGKIEIRLGNIDGQLLGVCNINSTGGAEIWQTFTTQVKKVKGVHDLYFVFKGGKGELFNLDYWKFK